MKVLNFLIKLLIVQRFLLYFSWYPWQSKCHVKMHKTQSLWWKSSCSACLHTFKPADLPQNKILLILKRTIIQLKRQSYQFVGRERFPKSIKKGDFNELFAPGLVRWALRGVLPVEQFVQQRLHEWITAQVGHLVARLTVQLRQLLPSVFEGAKFVKQIYAVAFYFDVFCPLSNDVWDYIQSRNKLEFFYNKIFCIKFSKSIDQ